MSYKPLPQCLTIKQSAIEGLGLFATEFIPKGTNLGRSHVLTTGEPVRTPLGGFYNHSDNPNCVKRARDFSFGLDLWTIKDIFPNEEITVTYTLYEVSTNNSD